MQGSKKGLESAYTKNKPQTDDVSGNERHAVIKSTTKRPAPEVQTTDLSAPPKYPPSHGMGIVQINLLKNLIASVKDKPFDMNDPDGGGIPLDKARAVFATLLMRGGVCVVVDAIKVKKSGKKFWGKKVVPILPAAQEVIDDFKKRKPGNWKALEEVAGD